MLTLGSIEGLRVGGRLMAGAALASGVFGGVALKRLSLLALILIIGPLAVYRAWNTPSIHEQIMARLRLSAVLHMGNVRTEGHGYKLLDEALYSERTSTESVTTMTLPQMGRFVIRALGSIVAVPSPWQIQSRSELLFLPEQVLWYLLILLAPIGLVAGLRRDALVTCALAGLAAVAAATIALNSGNIGTMARHRDMVVPFVVWLSALGAVASASHLMRPSNEV